MSASNDNIVTAGTDTTTVAGETKSTTVTPEETTVDWKAEAEKAKADADKWKAMSRKNEDNFKSASSKLEEYEKANLTDTEKAVAEAEAKGRNAAYAELLKERAEDKLQVAASKAGVDVSGIVEDLNFDRFIAEGSVNADAIESFVAKFAEKTNAGKGRPASELGVGQQGTKPPQLTRADLKGMTPADVAKAFEEGRLESLSKGPK